MMSPSQSEIDPLWFPNVEDEKKPRRERRVQIVTHLLSAHPKIDPKVFPRGIRQILKFHSDLHPLIMRKDGVVVKWNGRIEDIPDGWKRLEMVVPLLLLHLLLGHFHV